MSQQTATKIDQNKIQEFMNKAIQYISGSSTAMLIILGERLGLHREMSEVREYISAGDLAKKTGINERIL